MFLTKKPLFLVNVHAHRKMIFLLRKCLLLATCLFLLKCYFYLFHRICLFIVKCLSGSREVSLFRINGLFLLFAGADYSPVYVCEHQCHGGPGLSVRAKGLHSPLPAPQERAARGEGCRGGAGGTSFFRKAEHPLHITVNDEWRRHFTK